MIARRVRLSVLLVTIFAVPATPATGAEYVPGEVLVKFSDASSPAERSNLRATLAASLLHSFDRFGIEHWRLRDLSVESAVNAYRAHPAFAFVEPNYIGHGSAIPGDPLFGNQWPLHQANDKDIDAPEAWDT